MPETHLPSSKRNMDAYYKREDGIIFSVQKQFASP